VVTQLYWVLEIWFLDTHTHLCNKIKSYNPLSIPIFIHLALQIFSMNLNIAWKFVLMPYIALNVINKTYLPRWCGCFLIFIVINMVVMRSYLYCYKYGSNEKFFHIISICVSNHSLKLLEISQKWDYISIPWSIVIYKDLP
jgi:hypothetical protein